MNLVLNPPTVVRDIALLVARVLLGVVLIAHGLQKFVTWTLAGTAEAFGQIGVPAASVSAPVSAVIELVDGVLLLVGLFAPIAGLLVALQMGVAAVLVHVGNGVFVSENGWELVAVIAAAALAVGVAGAGRYSVDSWVAGRRAPAAAVVTDERESVNA